MLLKFNYIKNNLKLYMKVYIPLAFVGPSLYDGHMVEDQMMHLPTEKKKLNIFIIQELRAKILFQSR